MIFKKKLFLNILRQLSWRTIIYIGLIGIIEFYFLNKITILLINIFSLGLVLILLNKISTLKNEFYQFYNTLFNKENYFNHIYSILPQIIFKVRTDGSWEEVNTNWVELSGLNINDSLNFGWCKIIHPEDLENLRSEIMIAEFRGVGFSKEVRLITSDDSLKIINFSLQPCLNLSGKLDYFIGIIENHTLNKRINAMNTTSQKIDLLLNEKKSVNELIKSSLSIICHSFDFQFAGYWNLDSEENKLQLYDTWIPPNLNLHGFRAGQLHKYYAKGECLPGKAWQTKTILYIDDLNSISYFSRQNIAKMNDLKIALVVPIFINDNFYGILEFFCRHRIQFTPNEIETFNGIINRIGLSIVKKRTKEELFKIKQFQDQSILKKIS